jgi:transcriptional regulator with XRE-family HTH domain
MIINIDRKWCLDKANLEIGSEIGAGLIGIDPVPLIQKNNGHEESRIALGRFVQLNRRKMKMDIEKLSGEADIEISELMSIECDASYEPEPRTVYQLAVYFGVDQKKLMGLSGLTRPKDMAYVDEAVRYAARSESLKELSDEEQAALDGLISVLSEKT